MRVCERDREGVGRGRVCERERRRVKRQEGWCE
jgi:hypothetical protein